MHIKKEEKLLFNSYKELILSWGKTHNLMSKSALQEIDLHIDDSLSVATKIQGKNIIDLGSGAGFPGIPVAIRRKELKFYLVESNNKKSSFLFRTVHELGLTNVEVISERMENFFLKKTDVEIIARAFGDIDRAISTSSYYLDRGALLRLMKTNSQKQKIGKKLSKKYQIISTENIYSELRSQNILITVGSKCNKQEGN
ncbi:MAG: 16S rRNA (guanine(527)-N(7))-methyltransferase RsmG [SAR86 cluster bacterium]|nr:16S rRNA (guanine(527)-N(7))-methyltransferase RsmG [SAR86 cluster bacterium]